MKRFMHMRSLFILRIEIQNLRSCCDDVYFRRPTKKDGLEKSYTSIPQHSLICDASWIARRELIIKELIIATPRASRCCGSLNIYKIILRFWITWISTRVIRAIRIWIIVSRIITSLFSITCQRYIFKISLYIYIHFIYYIRYYYIKYICIYLFINIYSLLYIIILLLFIMIITSNYDS